MMVEVEARQSVSRQLDSGHGWLTERWGRGYSSDWVKTIVGKEKKDEGILGTGGLEIRIGERRCGERKDDFQPDAMGQRATKGMAVKVPASLTT